jgi:2-haloacid dehalogenase
VAFDVVETPDAAPALERLAAQHVPIAALTNGSAKITQHLLAASGLDRFVTTLVSIDEITTWKPAPAPYLHAAARLGVQPAELAMVAVHA